jgi:hypothetical protein
MVPDEEVELVSADTERSEHEERRILERFASFPSGNKSRPVSILLGGGCGGTPKGGRRRNKRKGCDSPRSSAEDKNNITTVKPEATTPDILPAGEPTIIDPFAEKCSNSGSTYYNYYNSIVLGYWPPFCFLLASDAKRNEIVLRPLFIFFSDSSFL